MAEILLLILLPRQRERSGVVLPCLGHQQEIRFVVPKAFDGDRNRDLVAELKNTHRQVGFRVSSGHLALFLLCPLLKISERCGIGSLFKRKNNARSDGARGSCRGREGPLRPVDVDVDVGVTQCACGGRVLERATSQPRELSFAVLRFQKFQQGVGCWFFLFPLTFSG